MSANFNAELYASKTRTAHATLNAEIYATADPLLYKVDEDFDAKRTLTSEVRLEADTMRTLTVPTTVNLIPELYASKNNSAHAIFNSELYATADPLLYRVNAEFDTKRIIENDNPQQEFKFDTKRSIANITQIEADTKRSLKRFIHTETNADTKRTIILSIVPNFDTLRTVESNLIQVSAFFDTKRLKSNEIEVYFDTKRSKRRIISAEFDTKRQIKDIVYKIELAFDVRLKETYTNYFYFDTRRRLGFRAEINADTKRTIGKNVNIECDTKRQMLLDLGKLTGTSEEEVETTSKAGVQNINLTLQTGTLSDAFTLTGINKIYPKEVVEGVLLDFPYHFQVEETKESGILFSVTRTSYNSDLMNYMLLKNDWKSINKRSYQAYNETGMLVTLQGIYAKDYCKKIADEMGFNLNWIADDFVPKELSEWATYQSYLSSLFGWTSNIPRKKYIVFIRNKTELYIVQRGKETGNINLDEYKWFNYPTYKRKQVRTTWMKPTDEGDIITGVKMSALYGVPSIPIDEIMGYKDTGSNFETADIEAFSRHDGSGRTDNRLNYTRKINPDGSVTETNYQYRDTGRDYVLEKITEVTEKETGVDPSTGIIVQGYKNTRITVYSYLPGGVRHTDVYENNVKVEESEEESGDGGEETNNTATNFDRVRPGDEGNEFLDDQTYLAHGSEWKTKGSSTKSSFLNDSEAPVLDYATAKMYFTELEWMDRAIEETATLTIIAPVKKGVIAEEDNHVFDFFDTYTLNGNVYYLESNSVSLTPRSLKQQLTLIRWYK